jgi:hypothetical protein
MQMYERETEASSDGSSGRLARVFEVLAMLFVAGAIAAWRVRESESPEALAALLGLLPALLALQYGFVAGLLVVGAVIGAVALAAAPAELRTLLAPMAAPFALALAAGHLRDQLRRGRAVHTRALAEKNDQLARLLHEHHALRASHARLEERLATSEWSIEAAVRETARRVEVSALGDAAAALLELLAVQGRVRCASLFVARGGVLSSLPEASLGAAPPCDAADRLVARAFERSVIVGIDRHRQSRTQREDVLAALPVIAADGTRVGVVAIHELPVVALHDAHLQLLATLLAPFAGALSEKLAAEETIRISMLPPPTRALAWLERETKRAPELASGVLTLPSADASIEGAAHG